MVDDTKPKVGRVWNIPSRYSPERSLEPCALGRTFQAPRPAGVEGDHRGITKGRAMKSKKLYIATEGSHEDYQVLGVFSTPELAQAALDRLGPPSDDAIVAVELDRPYGQRNQAADWDFRLNLWRKYQAEKPGCSWKDYEKAHTPDNGIIHPFAISRQRHTISTNPPNTPPPPPASAGA